MNELRKYYLKVCVLCYAVWLVAFRLVGFYAAQLETTDLSMGLDHRIPLMPVFVWPYHLCYLIPFLLVGGVRDPHRINRAILSFFLASLASFVVYVSIPISFPRPDPGTGFSARFLAGAYAIDFQPGANKLPSLHVALAWIGFLACRRQRFGGVGDAGLLLLAAVISVSTLFVKQHVILDVISGAILAGLAWRICGALYKRVVKPETPGPYALHLVVQHARKGLVIYALALGVIIGLIQISRICAVGKGPLIGN